MLVTDHTVPGLDPSGEVRVSRSAAIERSLRKTAAPHLRGRTPPELGVDPRSESVAWQVSIASAQPLADYGSLVDAADATMHPLTDMLHRSTGSALIYNPNPVVEQGSYSGLKDRNDKTRAAAHQPARAGHARSADDRQRLPGGPVRRAPGWARRASRSARPAPTSLDHPPLGQIRGGDGLLPHRPHPRLRSTASALSQRCARSHSRCPADAIPDDNSFYSSNAELVLGTGGVDDGEDADVIVHEYGHSLQDQAAALLRHEAPGGLDGRGLRRLHGGGDVDSDHRRQPVRHLHLRLGRDLILADNTCARRTDKSIDLKAAERKCQGDPLRRRGLVGRAVAAPRGAGNRHRGAIGHGPRRARGDLHADAEVELRDGARAIVAADQLLYGGAHVVAITAEMAQRDFCPAAGC